MGRKAQSPAQQAARGNPGKRPARTSRRLASVAAKTELKRPAWLTDAAARSIWGTLQRGAGALHFLRDTDVHVFGRYCTYMASWIEADRQLRESGGAVYETTSKHIESMLRINPWFTVRTRLEDDLVTLEEKLGLTPLDRLKIVQQLAQQPPGDLFAGVPAAEAEAPLPGEKPQAAVAEALPADIDVIGGLSNRRLDG